MLRRICELFLANPGRYSEDHGRVVRRRDRALIDEIEARRSPSCHGVSLRSRMRSPGGAPARHKRPHRDRLASAATLAAPRRSDLVDIAKTKGQEHLLAISGRQGIGEAITTFWSTARSGGVRNVAANRAARLSENGFTTLVKRAQQDGVLAEHVGQRPDTPTYLFRELVIKATDVVRRRLLASARPETQAEIRVCWP